MCPYFLQGESEIAVGGSKLKTSPLTKTCRYNVVQYFLKLHIVPEELVKSDKCTAQMAHDVGFFQACVESRGTY